MKNCTIITLLLLGLSLARHLKRDNCPSQDITDETCVMKRALAGLLRSSSASQDTTHREDMKVKVSKQKVLLELTPLHLEVIDDTHGHDIIRNIDLQDITVVNSPKVWLDNKVFCFQIVTQKGNHNGVHVLSDYLYGATDYDIALCFKDEQHKESWAQSIHAFSRCSLDSYHNLEDGIKHDIVKLQREQDAKKDMEFSRLNKKVDFLMGTTYRLKKQLRHQ